MADELADLVMPDKTPVKDLPVEDKPQQARKRHVVKPTPRNAAARLRSPRAGDLLFAACGLGLAGLCAVFPWYIFFNQEQFGIRPLTFSGGQNETPGRDPENLLEHTSMLKSMPQLDPIPTGTVSDRPDTEDVPDQPFPGNRAEFRLIHVANGRALIEDDVGFWIVQHGSRLPDGSRVSELQRQGDSWVLITSDEKEIALSR
ncbi:hypothetical protein [Chelativorans sp. YIM 93263]|uniref:hypothetical protein n=1 Tax=Chelativorans sp. YIM 93263 TaxID=2906648 RepID=UPI002379FE6D|nr:hypothetical protein [Chelativorans sp. YIM 93263]